MSKVLAIALVALAPGCSLFLGETPGSGDGDGDGDGDRDAGVDGPIPDLISDGLVARYFLAGGGAGGMQAFDAAADPFDLEVIQGNDNALSFCQSPEGHHAACWNDRDTDSRIQRSVAGSKIITALDGDTSVSAELVVEITTANDLQARLLQLGPAVDTNQTGLTVMSDDQRRLSVQFGNAARVAVDSPVSAGRIVVHAVIDTSRTAAEERIRIFVNGSERVVQADNCGAGPDCAFAVKQVSLALVDQVLTLGNRGPGGRSFQGALYYAALYSDALTPEQVAQQNAALQVSDDPP